MSALIVSCGRTGTNMLLEILRGSSALQATNPAEDKTVFRRPRELPDNYLSKCDTVYIDSFMQLSTLMKANKELKILCTIRDLRDCALSKIYRGQPGNDVGASPADDATFEGCLADIAKMVQVYDFLYKNYPNRVHTVKMEDVILNFDQTIEEVCTFIGVEFEDSMRNFTDRYRVEAKKRYKKLDKSQYQLYNRKYEIYDGFFKTHDIDLDELFLKLEPLLKKFGYIE